jgi:hypothetical protein
MALSLKRNLITPLYSISAIGLGQFSVLCITALNATSSAATILLARSWTLISRGFNADIPLPPGIWAGSPSDGPPQYQCHPLMSLRFLQPPILQFNVCLKTNDAVLCRLGVGIASSRF